MRITDQTSYYSKIELNTKSYFIFKTEEEKYALNAQTFEEVNIDIFGNLDFLPIQKKVKKEDSLNILFLLYPVKHHSLDFITDGHLLLLEKEPFLEKIFLHGPKEEMALIVTDKKIKNLICFSDKYYYSKFPVTNSYFITEFLQKNKFLLVSFNPYNLLEYFTAYNIDDHLIYTPFSPTTYFHAEQIWKTKEKFNFNEIKILYNDESLQELTDSLNLLCQLATLTSVNTYQLHNRCNTTTLSIIINKTVQKPLEIIQAITTMKSQLKDQTLIDPKSFFSGETFQLKNFHEKKFLFENKQIFFIDTETTKEALNVLIDRILTMSNLKEVIQLLSLQESLEFTTSELINAENIF